MPSYGLPDSLPICFRDDARAWHAIAGPAQAGWPSTPSNPWQHPIEEGGIKIEEGIAYAKAEKGLFGFEKSISIYPNIKKGHGSDTVPFCHHAANPERAQRIGQEKKAEPR